MNKYSLKIKLALLTLSMASLFVASDALASTLAVSPTTSTITNGQSTTVNIVLNAGGTTVDGVDIFYLHYNPAILQVQDSDSSVTGTQIAAGSIFGSSVVCTGSNSSTCNTHENVNSTNGTILFSRIAQGSNFNSTGTLASITFKGIAVGTSAITIDYTQGSTSDSNVVSGGVDTLSGVTNGSITVNTAVTPSTRFSLNDVVEVSTSTSVNVRATASTSGTLLGTQPDGAVGTVIGGSTYADSFHWWQINFNSGVDGWVAENFLIDYVAPLPTVTLSASPVSITSGSSSTLTWSSTNASTCTASGGWSGTKNTSGTQSVSPTSSTNYTLTCTGAGGSATQTAGVSVTTPSNTDTTAPVISNIQTSNTKYKTTGITWTTDEASDSQVEYGLTTSYGTSTTLAATRVTSHAMSLSSLQPGSTYHFRVKSRDAAGNLATSSDQTFQTLARLPKPPKPSGNLNLTSGSVKLSWTTLDYELCDSIKIFRDTSATPINDANKLITTLACTATTFDDTNVSSGTKYYYSLYVTDDVGQVSDPLSGSFTTPAKSSGGGGGGGGGGGTSGGSNSTSTPTPTPASILAPTTIPTTNTNAWGKGGRVKTTTILNVRSNSTITASLLGAQATGATGTIVDGPMTANAYTWWKINYDAGVDGWSVQNFLTLTSSGTTTTTPPPTPAYTPSTSPTGTIHIFFTKPTYTTDIATVKNLQTVLNKALGLSLTVDGKYGPMSLSAVKQFQAKYGLVADGKIGDLTRAKLNLIYP